MCPMGPADTPHQPHPDRSAGVGGRPSVTAPPVTPDDAPGAVDARAVPGVTPDLVTSPWTCNGKRTLFKLEAVFPSPGTGSRSWPGRTPPRGRFP